MLNSATYFGFSDRSQGNNSLSSRSILLNLTAFASQISHYSKIMSFLKTWLVAVLPGISDEDKKSFHSLGIENTEQLLQQGNTLEKRNAIAAELKLQPQQVNKWVALADLARLPGVGCSHCGLLLHSGVASVAQLAQTPVYRLHRQMLRFQVATLKRRDLCPPVEQVQQWVFEARTLFP